MSGYLLSRLVQTVLTLFVMSVLVFAGLYLVGNPVDV
jgi:peptide/nickel transport system permease protein